jgi:hypothetical protein
MSHQNSESTSLMSVEGLTAIASYLLIDAMSNHNSEPTPPTRVDELYELEVGETISGVEVAGEGLKAAWEALPDYCSTSPAIVSKPNYCLVIYPDGLARIERVK